MNTNNITSKKPGRPPVIMNWPNGEFTVDQLKDSTRLSKVTLYQKVKSALANKSIVIVGKVNNRQGRPKNVFTRTSQVATVAAPTVLDTVLDAVNA